MICHSLLLKQRGLAILLRPHRSLLTTTVAISVDSLLHLAVLLIEATTLNVVTGVWPHVGGPWLIKCITILNFSHNMVLMSGESMALSSIRVHLELLRLIAGGVICLKHFRALL